MPATLKTVVFGFIIATTSSYLGINTCRGTEGVGQASTRSVVLSSVLLIATNVLLVRLISSSSPTPCEPDAMSRALSPPSPTRPIRLDAVTKRSAATACSTTLTLDIPIRHRRLHPRPQRHRQERAAGHIVGLLQPDAGRVFVGGEDVTRLSSAELARVRPQIGFLFQNAALFDSLTVGENVAFPLRRHTDLGEAEIRDRALRTLDWSG